LANIKVYKKLKFKYRRTSRRTTNIYICYYLVLTSDCSWFFLLSWEHWNPHCI